MRKLLLTIFAAMLNLAAPLADAYTIGAFKNGFVVPYAYHAGVGDTTVVEITNVSGRNTPVGWVFFDQMGRHITDGCRMVAHSAEWNFVFANLSGSAIANMPGTLVFGALDSDTCGYTALINPLSSARKGLIAGTAYQAASASRVRQTLPVIGGDLTGPAIFGLAHPLNQIGLVSGATACDTFLTPLRQTSILKRDVKTRVVFWSTGDQRGTHTMTMRYSGPIGFLSSVNVRLEHATLDIVDLSKPFSRTLSSGQLSWAPSTVPWDFPAGGNVSPLAGSGRPVVVFSLIEDPSEFEGTQTVLGSHYRP